MGTSANSDVIKRLSRQFWLVFFLLVIPTTAFCASTTGMDFNKMLSALKDNSAPLIQFVVALAYVIGIWFIVASIMELKKVGQAAGSGQGGLAGPLVKMIIGVILVYLPSTIDIGVATLWGHGILNGDAGSSMSYTPNTGDPFSPAKEGAVAIVRVVGYVSFVRGLVMLSHTADQGSQPGSFGKGFMHVVGGILAINVVETIKIISNTLGFTT